MPLPTQTDVELPLLRVLSDLGGEAKPKDVYARVAAHFPQLTDEDLRGRMDLGAVKWWNDVQWARQRLVQKGEIDGSVHGVWRITDGRARLAMGESGRPQSSPRPGRQELSVPGMGGTDANRRHRRRLPTDSRDPQRRVGCNLISSRSLEFFRAVGDRPLGEDGTGRRRAAHSSPI
jgi:hypothetical protein